ncbi:MAG: hypothetical protein JST50_12515 [Bacteroidetes bacterium]|jgi:hypothetical protein|nr:hypothetical protein [Bacteroidota bacterium]
MKEYEIKVLSFGEDLGEAKLEGLCSCNAAETPACPSPRKESHFPF